MQIIRAILLLASSPDLCSLRHAEFPCEEDELIIHGFCRECQQDGSNALRQALADAMSDCSPANPVADLRWLALN